MAGPRKIQLILAFAALYIIWGSTYLGIFFAIQSIPPFLMAGSRFFLAGLIMFAIARLQGPLKSTWRDWRTSIVVGASLLLCGNGGVTISEKFIETGLASLIVATVPIYMTLLGWLIGVTKRPSGVVWIGLAGGFAGVAVLLGPELRFSGGSRAAIGISILLVTSFIWSAGSLYSRGVKHVAAPFFASAQQMFCGGLLLMLVGVFSGELKALHPEKITTLSIGAFAYLVLIGAIVGYTAYFWLLRNCDPSKVATYAYVNPIVAVLLGALFAHEVVSARTLFAGILIIGSVALIITVQQFRSKPMPPITAAIETECVR
ncbi:MAG TPA: EamA family transporter [Chthoniobacterales bacterium]|nr:EamA family transporter [Chthoniobacterales bacterium]